MNNIIEAQNVSKTFTNHKALDNVSINVGEGKVYGLLGPNGAGKTTLIRIITHITAPDTGTILFNGRPMIASDVKDIGYLPEERGLYKKMKVGEQAVFFARLKGLSRGDAVRELKKWFDKFEIGSWWNRKVDELSKGMAQKVQFIVTILHRPRLLIFDEPFSGFDPINANLLRDEILNLKNEGATVIFSTHNMASVEEICDDITLINNSHNILSGNVAELRREYSDGRYVLTFTGDPRLLITALDSVADDFSLTSDDRERSVLNLRVLPEKSLKEVIGIANNTVDLLGINERIASMNDIFIKAVNDNKLFIQQNQNL